MKKITSIIILLCMVFTVCSCNYGNGSSTYNMNDTTNDSSYDPKSNNKLEEINNVEITTVSKENNYYAVINSYNEKYLGEDFPNDYGVYFKIISSAEELSLLSGLKVDDSVFIDNYIIVLNIHDQWTEHDQRAIGYYGLKYENDEYYINFDYYYANNGPMIYDAFSHEFNIINYIVIPKTEIDYIDGVQEINLITNKSNQLWWRFIKHSNITPIYKNAASWMISDNDDFNKFKNEFGLSVDSTMIGGLLLYLPEEPNGDFIFSNIEIVDGNLYLTMDVFTFKQNGYLKENDSKFYLISPKVSMGTYIDYSELNADYNVYITINTIDVSII